MDKVKSAVEEMIAGLSYVEKGIAWSKPTANFSAEVTRTFELSQSVLDLDEVKSESDKMFEVVYDDMVTLVTAQELETERELKAFSINSATLTRTFNEKTQRWTYVLRFAYYMAL